MAKTLNAYCEEWRSRIEFFFLELYFRTKCGNSGRLAADFYLHPSEIPNAFILLHCALPLHTAGGGWEHCRRAQDNARNHTSAVTASIYTQCKDASTLHSNVQMSWGPIVANLAFGPIIVLAPSLVC